MQGETQLIATVTSLLRAVEAIGRDIELSDEARTELEYAKQALEDVQPGYERPGL